MGQFTKPPVNKIDQDRALVKSQRHCIIGIQQFSNSPPHFRRFPDFFLNQPPPLRLLNRRQQISKLALTSRNIRRSLEGNAHSADVTGRSRINILNR